MELGQKLAKKLHFLHEMEEDANLSLKSADTRYPGYAAEETAGDTLAKVSVQAIDKFSFAILQIELAQQNFSFAGSIPALVQKQAQSIEARIQYLQESLRCIELDRKAHIAQLRSAAPVRNGKARQYFEILLEEGKRLTIRRWEKHDGVAEREAVPFLLTEDLFVRLVNDLAGIWTVAP